MKKLFTLLTIIILLLSCGEYSDYQLVIDNRSSETIKIFFTETTAYTNGADSVISLPNSQNIYYNAIGRKMKDSGCDPQINENEVTIKISNNKTLIKDISNKENWDCETNKHHTYWKLIFIITPDDLL